MRHSDSAYGDVDITEPVIIELINSPSLQRLKEVDQIGYFEPYFPGTAHTRFDHSMGVFCLLKRYNAPLEEQIAGLIHDVSHSAFSHCIDYVLDAGSQKEHDHQDNVFDEYVKKSEIPAILEKYSIDPEYVLNDSHFPLKEKKLPDLCADRIDYSLRTAVIFNEIDEDGVARLFASLGAENGNWIFSNFESAQEYAQLFFTLNSRYYAGIESAIMFKTVGDYLRHALARGYIAKEDLYTTDRAVLAKVAPHHASDAHLNILFERMNNKIGCKNDPADHEAEIFCKSRIVDPLCRHAGTVKRVSDVDPAWKEVVAREMRPKQYFLKFER